ncbi:MAG: methyltransferase domain-containing protein [Chlorobiaceae bacterium]|nr:methyltransferase domain-containing protein [Chlorobiaceae bacterium]
MADFTDIASRYRTTSLVQASAGAQLIERLDISGNEDVLDVGCGTGNLTVELSKWTSGSVTGIDPSEGMIREASRAGTEPRINFRVMGYLDMTFREEFDIIFCNSAFQWFTDPSLFLEKAREALRSKGRIGVQAPARENYCPVFLKAISGCCANPDVRQVFSGFRSPWFFLETAEAYAALFRWAGFKVKFCALEESSNSYMPEKVFDVFSSGAKAGYLNPACYDSPFPEGFETTFLDAVKDSFVRQADSDGLIDLLFYRIFLIAEKS